MGKIIKILNTETGELKEFTEQDGFKYSTNETREIIRSKQDQQQKKEFFQTYTNEYGGFIFSIFKHCKEFSKHKELNQSDLARLIMLATYINYKGILVLSNVKAMNKNNMNQILKLGDRTFWEFYNKLIKLNIIYQEDENLYLNKKYFFKGEVSVHKAYTKQKDYTRLYINSIRFLYNNVSAAKHKHLGLIFRMIPYINLRWNLLCINPTENDLEIINIITLGELAELFDYDKKYLFQLRKDLLNIKLKDGSNIISFVECDTDITKKKVCINPQIIFGGMEVDDIFKIMEKFFQ